mgnify:CR=1 FL=1
MEIALPISQASRRELAGMRPDNFAPAATGREIVVANTSSSTADEYVLQGEVLSGRNKESQDAYGETYGPTKQPRQSSYQIPFLSMGQIRSGIEAYLDQPLVPNGALMEPQGRIDYYV